MQKIKKGDFVIYNESYKYKNGDWYFSGAKQVTNVHGNMVNLLKKGEICYTKEELILVCGFTEGQKIQCSMTNQNWKEYKFYKYDPNLAFPFLVKGTVNGFDNRIISFLYAKEIKVVE